MAAKVRSDRETVGRAVVGMWRESDFAPLRRRVFVPSGETAAPGTCQVDWPVAEDKHFWLLRMAGDGDACAVFADDVFLTFYQGKAKKIPLFGKVRRLSFSFMQTGKCRRPSLHGEECSRVFLDQVTISVDRKARRLQIKGQVKGMKEEGEYYVGAALEGCQTTSFSSVGCEVERGSDGSFVLSASLGKCGIWSPDRPLLYRLTLSLSQQGDASPCDRVQRIFGVPSAEWRGKHVGLHAADVLDGLTFEEQKVALKELRSSGISLLLVQVDGNEEGLLSLCDCVGVGVILLLRPDADQTTLRGFAQARQVKAQAQLHPSVMALWLSLDTWTEEYRAFGERALPLWLGNGEGDLALRILQDGSAMVAFLTDALHVVRWQAAVGAPDCTSQRLYLQQKLARRAVIAKALADFMSKGKRGYFILPPLSRFTDASAFQVMQELKNATPGFVCAGVDVTLPDVKLPTHIVRISVTDKAQFVLFSGFFEIESAASPALLDEKGNILLSEDGQELSSHVCHTPGIPLLYNMQGQVVACLIETEGFSYLLDLTITPQAQALVYRRFCALPQASAASKDMMARLPGMAIPSRFLERQRKGPKHTGK